MARQVVRHRRRRISPTTVELPLTPELRAVVERERARFRTEYAVASLALLLVYTVVQVYARTSWQAIAIGCLFFGAFCLIPMAIDWQMGRRLRRGVFWRTTGPVRRVSVGDSSSGVRVADRTIQLWRPFGPTEIPRLDLPRGTVDYVDVGLPFLNFGIVLEIRDVEGDVVYVNSAYNLV